MKNKGTAFFDMDRTLLRCESQQLLMPFLYKKELMRITDFVRLLGGLLFYKLGIIKNPNRMREHAISLLKSVDVKKFEEIIAEFWRHKLVQYLDPVVVDILRSHQQQGHDVVIVSACIEPLVRQLAAHLGCRGGLLLRNLKPCTAHIPARYRVIRYGVKARFTGCSVMRRNRV